MEYDYYNNPETWIGGFYELSMEYFPSGDSKRLNIALEALCKNALVKGLWKEKGDYPNQSISLPIHIENQNNSQFYGTLSLSNGIELPCVIFVTRIENESEWLDITIPQASFEKIFPYKYPLTYELNPWLNKIDEIYTGLAETIFANSPFDLAMIGEEITGYTNQEEITVKIVKNFTCILPNHLQRQLGLEGEGKELSNKLRMFEQTYSE
ncbi:hypothetical protein [Viridibacillus arvi]|uniref:hypothetical protein n=1 Tax=Viridibacillus arvi TaxID=263475 RepID=UPI0036E83666